MSRYGRRAVRPHPTYASGTPEYRAVVLASRYDRITWELYKLDDVPPYPGRSTRLERLEDLADKCRHARLSHYYATGAWYGTWHRRPPRDLYRKDSK